MKTIWKARIREHAKYGIVWEINIPAPLGAKALSVGLQEDQITVWFEVDTDQPMGRLRLFAAGTGRDGVPKNCRFIGTVIEGEHVFHIYGEI